MALPAFAPVAAAPHVQSSAGYQGRQWWIKCRCTVCGPRADWQRPCSRPHTTPSWIERYVAQHWHQ